MEKRAQGMSRRPALAGAALVSAAAIAVATLSAGGEGTGGTSEARLGTESDVSSPARAPVASRPNERRPWRPFGITPRVGNSSTVFRLIAPASPPNSNAPANYAAFELSGPGGAGCRGRLRARFGLGFAEDDDVRRRGRQIRYLPPQRRDPLSLPSKRFGGRLAQQPWCPGIYRVTALELRFKDARPRRVLGRVAFKVRRHPRPPESLRLRAEHGVTRAAFGKDIVGIPLDQMLARLGKSKTVPFKYRTSAGQRCFYYDVVSPAGGKRGNQLLSMWRLCLERGRVISAAGSPAIPLVQP